MSNPRVLHFLWSGNIGGAERAVFQIVREEAALGEWEVAVAFGRAEGPYFETLRSMGCEILDLDLRGGADARRARKTHTALSLFDLHHFHSLEPSQLLASAECRGVTRVFTQRHGVSVAPVPLSKKARRALGGYLLRRYCHAVAGNTRHAAAEAVRAYRLEGLPCEVTYNGIDFSLLTPERDRETVRRELGAQASSIVVGSSGTLKGWKRFERLLDLLPTNPLLRAVVVGDGGQRPALEARARELGVTDRLRITGLVDDVPDYLGAMDVFVLPSTADESFGNSVVEAMALGLPAIVFADSPGICEHIESGVTGFIVGDQEELASTVARLASDPALRAKIGQAGSDYVRSTYTLENMHASYRRLYERAFAYSAAKSRR